MLGLSLPEDFFGLHVVLEMWIIRLQGDRGRVDTKTHYVQWVAFPRGAAIAVFGCIARRSRGLLRQ